MTEKYGTERVAQIVTYGTIKSKQALKDSSRVLGFPFGMGERLTKAMPPAVMGKDIPLSGIFDADHPRYKEAGDLRALIETDAEAKTVFETARGLENLKRQWGVHAAGVIMSSDPLIDIIPVMKRELDGAIITQFDYPACEALGLIKMDFLGLRNLGAYELLGRGDTLGVFQLDGGPLRSLLRLMKPDSFGDISAVIALYRPGPMGADSHTNYALRKNGLQPITPIHPELEEPLAEILGESYGLIIYQEQVMAVAQTVAGYTLARWARRRSPSSTSSSRRSRAACTSAATPPPPSRRCGTCCCRSPTTPSTRRTPPPTASSPTGPPTSRRATRPSTWRRC